MFYARREVFRTNLDKAPDEPKKLLFPSFASGKRPGSSRPNKVATVDQKLALTSGKPRAVCSAAASDISIFVAEVWAVIQVRVASKQSIVSICKDPLITTTSHRPTLITDPWCAFKRTSGLVNIPQPDVQIACPISPLGQPTG